MADFKDDYEEDVPRSSTESEEKSCEINSDRTEEEEDDNDDRYDDEENDRRCDEDIDERCEDKENDEGCDEDENEDRCEEESDEGCGQGGGEEVGSEWIKRREEVDSSDTTEDEEEVDPRVAENLEIMNQSCAEVNRLENEVDEARSKYRSTFQTASHRMEELSSKIRKNIQRARQYYELSAKAKEAQSEALRAARQFQTANGNYRAAKEMMALAEKGLDSSSDSTQCLSSAWQETLSHAIERVMEAEREKTRTESEHNKRTAICTQMETQIHYLEKKYKRSITKARPYFETKAELELKLQQLKQNVWDLQQTIGIQKTRYAEALRCLEAVSTEIHETRRSRANMLLHYPREPGVGAETDSLTSSISDVNIERGIFSPTASVADEEDDESDEVGDVFHPDICRVARERSDSKRSACSQQGADDCRSVNSSASENVISRSVSNASVFSSESQSDSGPHSPVSISPTSTRNTMTAPHPPHSLLQLAQGDVNSRTKDGQVDSLALSSAKTREHDSAINADTSKHVQGEMTDNFYVDLSTAGCQREAGDGSAQDECLHEPGNLNDLETKPTPVCSQSTSVSSQSPPEAKSVDEHGEHGTADVLQHGSGVPTSGPCPPGTLNGEVKKLPLRRTDAPRHRSLQGVMLLNPSDLASSSTVFHYGP